MRGECLIAAEGSAARITVRLGETGQAVVALFAVDSDALRELIVGARIGASLAV